jgi:hypothetical protein
MIERGDPVKCAREAGYSHPSQRAYDLMKRPDVVAAIHSTIQGKMQTEGASVAFRVLVEIANDEKAPKAPRVAAARTLAEMSGLSAGAGAGALDKPPSEMSRAELIEARERALAVLASLEAPRMIEGSTIEAPETDTAAVSALFD